MNRGFKKSVCLAGIATIAMALPALAAPVATLTVVATPGVDLNGDPLSNGGSWTVYFQDSLNDNAGLADYVIDVIGSKGLTVTSSQDDAGSISSFVTRQVAGKSRGFATGFGSPYGNGNNGIEIFDFQRNLIYSNPGENNAIDDTLVYQGVGQIPSTSNAQAVADGVSWGVPVDLASGTYSGAAGTLTVGVHPGDAIQYLIGDPSTYGGTDTGGTGTWKGPGNVGSFSGNILAYPAIVSPVPEPAIGALAIGALALLARRRK